MTKAQITAALEFITSFPTTADALKAIALAVQTEHVDFDGSMIIGRAAIEFEAHEASQL